MRLILPFTGLTTNPDETIPPWKEFPAGVEVAAVPQQPVDGGIPRLSIFSHSLRYSAAPAARYYVLIQGSFSDYLKKFKSKARKNLNHSVKKFAEFCGGPIHWAEFRTPQEMGVFCRLADEVAVKSWQGKLRGQAFTGRLGEAFIAELAAKERARGYVLFHQGRPVAYVFCEVWHDALLYGVPGYNEEYARWSPGTVLLYLLLEKLFTEQSFKLLDFDQMPAHYKTFFSTGEALCARVVYFRPSVRNYGLAGLHFLLTMISVSTGKLAAALDLRKIVRRILKEPQRAPAPTQAASEEELDPTRDA